MLNFFTVLPVESVFMVPVTEYGSNLTDQHQTVGTCITELPSGKLALVL